MFDLQQMSLCVESYNSVITVVVFVFALIGFFIGTVIGFLYLTVVKENLKKDIENIKKEFD